MASARFVCPVCGYPELGQPPWAEGVGSDETCPSCGTHFGYDDVAGGDDDRRERVHSLRRLDWMAGGMRWWSQGRPSPPGWDPTAQVIVLADTRARNEPDDWLPVAEAAERLGLSTKWFMKTSARSNIPLEHRPGVWGVRWRDVEDYIERSRITRRVNDRLLTASDP